MSTECHQFEYRAPWLMIAAFLYFTVALVSAGLTAAFGWDPNTRFTPAWILCVPVALAGGIAGGAFFGSLAFRMILNRLKHRQRITLTETALKLPRYPWSTAEVSIPYETMTTVRYTFSRPATVIAIRSSLGRFRITSLTLPRRANMDELIGILEERLKPVGVQIERREAWFGGRWTRPQFSLRSLLVLTTVAGIVLGLAMCLEADVRGSLLAFLACQLILIAPPLLALVPWRRPGKIFAAGYLIGIVLEGSVATYLIKHEFVQLAPATGAPVGWYPLSLPINRLIVAAGWTDPLGAVLWATWAGCLVSGLLLGTASVAAWYLIAWPIRRLRRS